MREREGLLQRAVQLLRVTELFPGDACCRLWGKEIVSNLGGMVTGLILCASGTGNETGLKALFLSVCTK